MASLRISSTCFLTCDANGAPCSFEAVAPEYYVEGGAVMKEEETNKNTLTDEPECDNQSHGLQERPKYRLRYFHGNQ